MRAIPSVLAMVPLVATTSAAAPLRYLSGAGEKASPVVGLTWGVLLISLIVIAVIGVLLAGAIWRRPGQAWIKDSPGTLLQQGSGLDWLWIGVGISTFVLLITVVWTVRVLAQVQSPPVKPAVTIEVTGRQWWWQVRYLSDDAAREFTTANEIHIPAGVPVRMRLVGGDVIHSFWVPQLAGKMDAIPGQTNETWIEAAAPGVYRGQCTEYCGLQHAHMGMLVIAQSESDFRKWWSHQLTAPAESSGKTAAGEQVFQMHCGSCHAIRGTDAAGAAGPDLSHLMERSTIAAATLPNTPANLARWVADPQSLKPGSQMPAPSLSGSDLKDVGDYLRTLD